MASPNATDDECKGEEEDKYKEKGVKKKHRRNTWSEEHESKYYVDTTANVESNINLLSALLSVLALLMLTLSVSCHDPKLLIYGPPFHIHVHFESVLPPLSL